MRHTHTHIHTYLQHTTTHCNTLQRTVTHTLQHITTHCNTLQRTTTHALQHTATQQVGRINSVSLTHTHIHTCNTLQHTATRCNTRLTHTRLTHTKASLPHTHTLSLSHTHTPDERIMPRMSTSRYGVVTISRLIKIIGLFCKRAL